MKKLTSRQQGLVDLVTENPGLNTHQLARLRDDHQAYESYLCERLFRLTDRGLLEYEEVKKNHCVIERKWFPVEDRCDKCNQLLESQQWSLTAVGECWCSECWSKAFAENPQQVVDWFPGTFPEDWI